MDNLEYLLEKKETEKNNITIEIEKLRYELKKLIKSVYISRFSGYIHFKNKELEKYKDNNIVNSLIKNNILERVINKARYKKVILEIMEEIKKINDKYNLRLEEILENKDQREIDKCLLLIEKIDEFYIYKEKKEQYLAIKKELKELELIIKEQKYLNTKIEPLIDQIEKGIQYTKSIETPKKMHLIKYHEYKKSVLEHNKILKKYTDEILKYLAENIKNNTTLKHEYFHHETSVKDTISDIIEFQNSDDYVKIYNILKNTLEETKIGIDFATKTKNKKKNQVDNTKLEKNIFFDEIIENLKNKTNRYIFYIVNALYKLENNEAKKELFKKILITLKVIYNLDNNIDNLLVKVNDVMDYEILFVNSIFKRKITAESINTNIELYKTILELYKEDELNIKKVAKN